jgi:hypothetical protein
VIKLLQDCETNWHLPFIDDVITAATNLVVLMMRKPTDYETVNSTHQQIDEYQASKTCISDSLNRADFIKSCLLNGPPSSNQHSTRTLFDWLMEYDMDYGAMGVKVNIYLIIGLSASIKGGVWC